MILILCQMGSLALDLTGLILKVLFQGLEKSFHIFLAENRGKGRDFMNDIEATNLAEFSSN